MTKRQAHIISVSYRHDTRVANILMPFSSVGINDCHTITLLHVRVPSISEALWAVPDITRNLDIDVYCLACRYNSIIFEKMSPQIHAKRYLNNEVGFILTYM